MLKKGDVGFYTPLPLRRCTLTPGLLVVVQPTKRLALGRVKGVTPQAHQLNDRGDVVGVVCFPVATYDSAYSIFPFEPF